MEERLAETRERSAIVRILKAVSYGPFGSIRCATLGFIIGTVGFLVRDSLAAEHDLLQELPLLLTLSLGGAAVMLIVGTAANYLIGRSVRDEAELRAKIRSGEVLAPSVSRAELPGIDLLVRSGAGTSQSRGRKIEARTEEMA